jgi:DNA-binding transcriptional ArsR family regulator
MTGHTERQARFLSALAHPNRLRIVQSLRAGECCSCELGPKLGLEQSNLSRHLKQLVEAGVIVSRRRGFRVEYRIADKRVLDMLDRLELFYEPTKEECHDY